MFLASILLACGQIRFAYNSANNSLTLGRRTYEESSWRDLKVGERDLDEADHKAGQLNLISDGRVKGRLDLDQLLKGWLATDAFWKDHAEANELRYLGVFAEITQTIPVSRTASLAILAIRSTNLSGEPAQALFLARIEAKPLRLTVLKRVPVGGNEFLTAPLLYRVSRRILLLNDRQIDRISSSGAQIETWKTLPKNRAPEGLVDRKWFAVTDWTHHEVTDLSTKNAPFQDLLIGLDKSGTLLDSLQATSSFVLLRDDSKVFCVHLPDLNQTSMPPDTTTLIGPYALALGTEPVHVYDPFTGKQLGLASRTRK